MVKGWGRVHTLQHKTAVPSYVHEISLERDSGGHSSRGEPITFHGMGRSYGDLALNDGGLVLVTQSLKRIQSFDAQTGILKAEAGISLDEVLEFIVPKGWFLPVTPGSKFVSLGGAVANDVHGKNHHHTGSLGAFVLRLGLMRSDGERLTLSRTENSELFNLTISGLGLTGFIEWVELQLNPIRSSDMDVENRPYNSLEEFYELSRDSNDWPYAVAWLDCLAKGRFLGRGIFTRARHSLEPKPQRPHPLNQRLSIPIDMPPWLLNRYSITAFNFLYRNRPSARYCGRSHYNPFFYPLDGIKSWNKLYGKRGFFQHQCIIPKARAFAGISQMLETISHSGQGSFLAVLKNHGEEISPGANSFCLEGTSLALDFPNLGQRTKGLIERLDEIVKSNGGRLYPAKDACMSAAMFQAGYPNWRELEKFRDPAINSAFWQRVTREVG